MVVGGAGAVCIILRTAASEITRKQQMQPFCQTTNILYKYRSKLSAVVFVEVEPTANLYKQCKL